MTTVLLLLASNTFMTIAWYGHLRFRDQPIVVVILASWLIALPEYALQVPGNRIGYLQFSVAQLKVIQEVIAIAVFVIFNAWYFQASLHWNDWLAFGLIVAAVIASLYPKLTPAGA
jgi:uncharacterized protein (DUF486 family)